MAAAASTTTLGGRHCFVEHRGGGPSRAGVRWSRQGPATCGTVGVESRVGPTRRPAAVALGTRVQWLAEAVLQVWGAPGFGAGRRVGVSAVCFMSADFPEHRSQLLIKAYHNITLTVDVWYCSIVQWRSWAAAAATLSLPATYLRVATEWKGVH